jgi:ATP-dependent DNA helicase RecQ
MMSLSLPLQLKHLTDTIGHTLDGRLLGCLLGSANKDRGIEEAALRGDYLLVYLTPEKLSSDGFLDGLAPLVERNGILLLAVDEAHCVSEVLNPDRIRNAILKFVRTLLI